MWPQKYIYNMEKSLFLHNGLLFYDGKLGPLVTTQVYHVIVTYISRRVRRPHNVNEKLGVLNLGENMLGP